MKDRPTKFKLCPGWLQLGVKSIMKELFVYAAFKINGSLKYSIPVEVLKTLKA